MKRFLVFLIIIFVFSSLFVSNLSAVTDSVDVSIDISSSCGNNICESEYGENFSTCPQDCLCNNNGICEPNLGETYQNCPNDCHLPQKPGGKVDIAEPVVFNVIVRNITLTSADVHWETDEPALCQFFWGRTYEYKEESISESSLSQEHLVSLASLSPNTVYHFKMRCRDKRENEEETKDYHFSTLSPPDEIPPPNIIDFEAIAGDKKIDLGWKNPLDLDFSGVRIMRSTQFYPSNPWEGEPVYEGRASSFTDKDLENRVRYYYTAFSYDEAGNFSSGAVASAVPQSPLAPPVYPSPPIKPPVEEPPPEIEEIDITDFNFVQDEEKLSLIEKKGIKVKGGKLLDISINYQEVPEVLKTIMVTLEKEDKFFSFLLRVNKSKTVYQATLLVPVEAGVYPLTINILDYKNQALKEIKGFFMIEGEKKVHPEKLSWYRDLDNWKWILFFLLLIILALILRHILKEHRKKKIKREKSY